MLRTRDWDEKEFGSLVSGSDGCLTTEGGAQLMRPHLQLMAPAVFAVVRDMVIPVKLAAEQAFVAMFEVVEGEVIFEVSLMKIPFYYS